MKNEDLLNISNNDNKKNLRKILVYVAIGFLIFVIAIIAVALYQNKSSKEENAILPPQVNISQQNQELFKQVPIETENDTTQNTKNKQINNLQNTNQVLKQTIKQEPKSQHVQQNVIQKEPLVTNSIQKQKTSINKTKNTSLQNTKKNIHKPKYYIQVAALLKNSTPNKKFLQLISKYGYKYIFYTTYIKRENKKIRVTKILIGSFKNKKDALTNLSKIKKYITSNAFIFKVK